MSDRYTIVGFEADDRVVLKHEDGRSFYLPRHWLPEAATQGDILRVERDDEIDPHPDQSGLHVYIDHELTGQLTEIEKLRGSLAQGLAGDFE